MPRMPRDRAFDATLAIVRDGYDFVWKRCRRLQTDAFRTRVMLRPAICLHGPDAARLFYDESKLKRHAALPRRVVTSLFGKRAVHTLDDGPHRARKAAFLALMSPEGLASLMEHTTHAWRSAVQRWEQATSVVLFDETQ